MPTTEVYHHRKAAGRCPNCGRISDRLGAVRCTRCIEKARKPRDTCQACPAPAVLGHRHCPDHLNPASPWAAGTTMLLQPLAERLGME